MLKQYIGDPESILPIEGLGDKDTHSYEEVRVQIHYREVMKLRNKQAVSVKVLWKNHLVKGAKWEAEADMMSRYPRLYVHPLKDGLPIGVLSLRVQF